MKLLTAYCTGLAFLFYGFVVPPLPAAENTEKGKVVFAVIDDGTIIEPVAIIAGGMLVPAIGGEPGSMELPAFASMYYSPETTYTLITGGKANGKVTVVSNDPGAECAAAMAAVTTTSAKIKLKGHAYALATNIRSGKPASGIRRAATPAEKAAIDKLVAAEFRKNKSAVKLLKAVRLTVLDTDNDKVNEIVGTYTVAPAAKERGLLFFIATKTKTGGYSISFSEYNAVKQDEVMSGDIKDVDGGVYQEMLLDVLDTDNSGASKIFTMKLSFEGVGFHIYKRNGGKWEQETEVSNYHCGY
jgi:hypothetical protein